MVGHNVTGDNINVSHLINAESIEKIFKTTWERFWGKFISFGTFSAGLLGFFLVFRLIKFVIDSALQGYALYLIYGFSVYILAAFWDSLTQLLLHLGHEINNYGNQENHNVNPPNNGSEVTSGVPEVVVSPSAPAGNELYPLLGRSTIDLQGVTVDGTNDLPTSPLPPPRHNNRRPSQ